MIKKRNVWMSVCAGVFLAGIAGSIWVLTGSGGTTVNISQDGKTVYTFALSDTEDQTIEMRYEGRSNTLEIADGKIRVLEADCPDQVCVKTGWLKNAMPIVCLPNHLVIEFAESEGGTDAVAQ